MSIGGVGSSPNVNPLYGSSNSSQLNPKALEDVNKTVGFLLEYAAYTKKNPNAPPDTSDLYHAGTCIGEAIKAQPSLSSTLSELADAIIPLYSSGGSSTNMNSTIANIFKTNLVPMGWTADSYLSSVAPNVKEDYTSLLQSPTASQNKLALTNDLKSLLTGCEALQAIETGANLSHTSLGNLPTDVTKALNFISGLNSSNTKPFYQFMDSSNLIENLPQAFNGVTW